MTNQCPACKANLDPSRGRGASLIKAMQNHFWGKHRVDVIRSHVLANKLETAGLSDEEIEEIKQMSLPLAK